MLETNLDLMLEPSATGFIPAVSCIQLRLVLFGGVGYRGAIHVHYYHVYFH